MEMERLQSPNGAGARNGNPKPFIPSSSNRMMMPGRSRFNKSYQVTRRDKIILWLSILLNTILLLLAGGILGVGTWVYVDRGSWADLCGDNEWFVAAGFMLAIGSLAIYFVILSYVAVCRRSSRLLFLYMLFVLFLFIGELTTGIYVIARKEHLEGRFSACMKDAYQTKYFDPSFKHVTKAWNKLQDRFDCCGVDDPLDFVGNRNFPSTGANAPESCGGTKADASAKQPCFETIKREVLDNFRIIALVVFVVAAHQIFLLVSNFFLLRLYREMEEYE